MSLSTAFGLQFFDADPARHSALDYVTEAFAEAVLDGVEAQAFAEAAIAVALRELVCSHGEERVACAVQTLSKRVQSGEFSSTLRQ